MAIRIDDAEARISKTADSSAQTKAVFIVIVFFITMRQQLKKIGTFT